MDDNMKRICLLVLLFNVVHADISSTNDTNSENRNPRVSGRIVKLYTGSRPDPIYCPEEGFQPDPANCAIFYRCVRGANYKFTVFRFQCGPGTIYDPDTEVCNFPQSTKRSECGGFPQIDKSKENEIEGLQPEKPTIISSRPSYLEPGDGSSYNLRPWNHSENTHTTASYPQTITLNKISSTKGLVFQSQPSRKEGEICTKDGFLGDSDNCRKFYRCVGNQRGGFMRYEFSCSETTVWDDEVQSCNHPWAVQRSRCGRTQSDNNMPNRIDDNQASSVEPSQKQLQISYGEKVTQTQTQINHGNVIQNQTQINYGDHNNKKQFSEVKQNQKQISYGSAISQTQTQLNYGNGVQTQLQIDHTKGSSQNQAQIYEKTTKKSTTSSTTQKYEDNHEYGMQPSIHQGNVNKDNDGNDCTESGFMSDKNDCQKFYRCVDNGNRGYIRYTFLCGEGTVWDDDIAACNHPWAVKKCGGAATDINKIETTTAQSTTVTVLLMHTTTQTPSENVDNDSTNGQQSSESSTTTTTTKIPQYNEDNDCKTSGFMGDKNDCKRFYRCVDNGKGGYTRYDFSCGEGTVWDPKIEGCNHAWAVERCGASSTQDESSSQTAEISPSGNDEDTTTTLSTETPNTTASSTPFTLNPSSGKNCSQEGFIGDESDCKKFYRCVDNGQGGFIKYEFSCGDGTIWDSEITACNHPSSDIRCGTLSGSTSEQPAQEGSTKPYQENDEMFTVSTINNSIESSTEQTQNADSSHKPQVSNDKCISEGFFGDSDNCKMFYRCVDNGKGGYTKYDFTCGDGTIWDQEIQACNHKPSDSKCSTSSQSQTEPSEGNTSISSPIVEEQASTQRPQQPSSESTNNCTSEGFYANEQDCKKFYRCVDNGKGGFTKYEFSCGEGTMWIQEIQACDHDNGESCTTQNAYSSTTIAESVQQSSDSSTQQPNKQDDESPNQTSTETNLSESNDDANKCKSEGFYPNKKDCTKFYRCVDNGNGMFIKYDFDCGEGTAWDSEIQTCNHIAEVKECQNQEHESNQPMHDEKPQSSNSTGTTQTSTSGPVTESSKPTNNDTCKEEGYYGNSQDCKKFYRCVDNGKGGFTKYDFTCGEGTIWDQEITTCNHPQDVSNPSCQQSGASDSSTSSTTSTSSSSSTDSSSSTTESNSSDCSQNSTKKPENKNVNCTKAGYYADPNDCKKFYRCVDWDGDEKRFSVYYFECGEGTIWDPALDTCNHEDSVYPPRDCSGGTQSQGENVDQESTTKSTTESETTYEESTTKLNTTQESTTSEHTTHETTTEQTTTNEQTTSQQTTSESTTEQSTEKQTTTQQTTSEQTTSQTTNEQTTTQESTTQESNTESSQQSTTQQTTESESTTTEDKTTESTTTDETTTENKTTEESTTESSTTQGTTEQSSTNQTDENETTESELSTTSQYNDSSTTESEQEPTTESGGEQTTESNASDKECPETDDDQNLFVCPTSFIRHPKYCNMFYQCTEDDDTHDVQIASFRCPNNTIYDESKTQCVEEKKAEKKCDGEIAQKRRLKRFDTVYKEPIIVTNERLKCPAPGHYPFEQGECSSAFLKCQKTESGKIRGFVYQCPQEHMYWAVSRRCEPKTRLRDCKQSHNNWKGRWEIPIERRNVAP